MHELMAAAGALILISLMITQTAAETGLFIRAAKCERTVREYCLEEYEEEEIPLKMEEMARDLNSIPKVDAKVSDRGLTLVISGVIGPAKMLGIRDNSIKLEKDLILRVKEAEDEEPDSDFGPDDSDGTGNQEPGGDYNDDTYGDIREPEDNDR